MDLLLNRTLLKTPVSSLLWLLTWYSGKLMIPLPRFGDTVILLQLIAKTFVTRRSNGQECS